MFVTSRYEVFSRENIKYCIPRHESEHLSYFQDARRIFPWESEAMQLLILRHCGFILIARTRPEGKLFKIFEALVQL